MHWSDSKVLEKNKLDSTSILTQWIPVTQEHILGCSVACVASRLGRSYDDALRLFDEPANAWQRGFYCPEIIRAFERAGFRYQFESIDHAQHSLQSFKPGTIVFTAPSLKYAAGHFLLLTPHGWMNSWINCPRISPALSGYEAVLSDRPLYVLFEEGVQTKARHSPLL